MAGTVWRKQPPGPAPLDWGAAITHGLAFAAPLGPGDGMRDLVRSVEGTRTGLGTRGIAQSGSYPIFGSSDYLSFPTLGDISGTTPVTIAWTQQPTSIVNGFPIVLAWKPTGATNRFLIICGPTASYQFCAGPQNGASSTASWDPAIGPSAVGRHNNFVLQVKAGTDSADRTTFELFRDGVKITRDTFATSFGVDSTAEFLIGKRSGGDGFQGHIGNFHIWRRVLTDSEALDWTRNPYITRLALPQRRRAAAAAGGGAAVTCTGIASAEAFGTATVTRRAAVTATGIASAEAFGTAAVARRAAVTATGIASAEAFGTATVVRRTASAITTTGIASAEAFGTHTLVRRTSATITTTGIASAEAFGTHVLLRASVRGITTTGIASAEAVGTHVLLRASVRGITTTGIASAEAIGTASVTRRQGVTCTGIASAQAFGVAVLTRNGVAPPASGKVSRVNMRIGLSL